MTAKKKTGKNRRDALAPACYKDVFFFEHEDTTCKTCPMFFPCGAYKHGVDLAKLARRDRKSTEMEMVQKRVPFKDAIFAITKMFQVTSNAASLSYSRRKKRVR